MLNTIDNVIRNIEDRLFRLNKKIDILSKTARESMSGTMRETHVLNNSKLEYFITKFENGGNADLLYKEWKQDLMVRYFDPRTYKNRV